MYMPGLTQEEKIEKAHQDLKNIFQRIEGLGKFKKEISEAGKNKVLEDIKKNLKEAIDLIKARDLELFSKKKSFLDQDVSSLEELTVDVAGLKERIAIFQEIINTELLTATPTRSTLQKSISELSQADTDASRHLDNIRKGKDLFKAHEWIEKMEKKFQLHIPGRSLKIPEKAKLPTLQVNTNLNKRKRSDSSLSPLYELKKRLRRASFKNSAPNTPTEEQNPNKRPRKN